MTSIIDLDKWLAKIDERIATRKELNLYHIDLPLDMFELVELRAIIDTLKVIQEEYSDDLK